MGRMIWRQQKTFKQTNVGHCESAEPESICVCILWIHQGVVRVRQDCMRSYRRLRNGSRGVGPTDDIKDLTVQMWWPLSATHARSRTSTHTQTKCYAQMSTRSQWVWFSDWVLCKKLGVKTKVRKEWGREKGNCGEHIPSVGVMAFTQMRKRSLNR